MALYTYRALDKQGEIIQDKVEGSGEVAVVHELRQQGLLVIDVKEQSVAQKDILAPFKGVKLADLVVFSRQLATMINAGLPIVRALYVLSEQTENPKLKDVVVEVRKDVEAGSYLSEALEKHPKAFSRLYVEMVKAGEIGGLLDSVLLRIADQLEKDQDLRRKIRSAMTYPVVVLVLAILAASFMLIFIVPVFAKMFQDLGGTLPLPTRVCMLLSNILTSLWGILLYAAMGLGVYLFFRWKKTEQGRKVWGRTVLKIPAKIGDVVQKVVLARFARTLGTLSAAGVPILQAIEITATSSGNWVVEKALLKSRDAIREGIPIYKPLEEEPVFPPMVTRMIAVGEETGDIDGMLTKIAEFYESEVDAAVKALPSKTFSVQYSALAQRIRGGIVLGVFQGTRRQRGGRTFDPRGGLRQPRRGSAPGSGRRGGTSPLRRDGQPLRPQPDHRPRGRRVARRGRGPSRGRPPHGGQPGQPHKALYRCRGGQHLRAAGGRHAPAPDPRDDPGRRLRGRRRPQPHYPAGAHRVGLALPRLRPRYERQSGIRRADFHPRDGREGPPRKGDDRPSRRG